MNGFFALYCYQPDRYLIAEKDYELTIIKDIYKRKWKLKAY